MSEPAATPRLLVVDDEPNIRALLCAALGLAGYEVRTASTGRDALNMADGYRPDLVVLDVMLPDLDGPEVARRLRQRHPVPVLFLTARDAATDWLLGAAGSSPATTGPSTVGADPSPGGADSATGPAAMVDDRLTKPFSLEEVTLRVRAMLRRNGRLRPGAGSPLLRYADLELDEDTREVHRAGRLIDLSPTEFKLLRYLLGSAGRVVSRAQILDQVWHYDFGGDGRIVESYIYYLRRKIDLSDPPLIHTVREIGYALRLPVKGSDDPDDPEVGRDPATRSAPGTRPAPEAGSVPEAPEASTFPEAPA